MPRIYETGHAKNVGNLQEIISFCTSYTADYNPSKNAIKLNALNQLLNDAQTELATVTEKVIAFNTATNIRKAEFETLKKLATRLINALEATDATDKTIADARTINRKIQGTRAGKKTTPKTTDTTEQEKPKEESTQDNKSISVSQQSCDQLIEHFSKLIALLNTEPSYMPNEKDLQITTLTAKLANMKAANLNVIKTYIEISNARIARNKILYQKDTGIHDLSQAIKKYIKSTFGATSPQYKQISSIVFTKKA